MEKELIFVPSIGPGYHDLRVRPWNNVNTKERRNGGYYQSAWNEVLKINEMMKRKKVKHPLIEKHLKMNGKEEGDDTLGDGAPQSQSQKSAVIQYVSITSFNEWHEGTQIEPSIAKESKNGYKYLDFESDGGADSYMKMTRDVTAKFLAQF